MRIARMMLATAALAGAGCSAETLDKLADQAGLRVAISGEVEYTGSADYAQVALDFKLYRYLENQGALDSKGCPAGTGPDSASASSTALPECFGRLNIDKLTKPVVDDEMSLKWTAGTKSFKFEDAPADVAFIMVVRATADDARCSTDVIGYDEESKLVKKSAVISPIGNGGQIASTSMVIPRKVRISCEAVAVPEQDTVVPTPTPEPDPEVIDEVPEDEGNDLPTPKVSAWTVFQLMDTGGGVVADASNESVPGDSAKPPCGLSVPLAVHGKIDGFAGEVAYIHIQEGSGEHAIVRDQKASVVDGEITGQVIQLSGGYARVQLDTAPIETSDFSGASRYIEVCSADGGYVWPNQELLTVVSWDTQYTDVDTHVWVDDGTGNEDHIWYSRRDGTNASLDVDDTDGFGPETVTSNESITGKSYDVQVHFYGDHGYSDPPTNVVVRVIYANKGAGVYCDNAVSVPAFESYSWQPVGKYGPALVELATSDPTAFAALGCIKPE